MLKANHRDDSFQRLDDMLGDAVVLEEPALSAVQGAPGILLALEFDGRDPVTLETVGDRADPRIAHGVVELGGAALMNREQLRVSKDEVGSIVIRARSKEPARLNLAWSKRKDPKKIWANALGIDLVGDSQLHTCYFRRAPRPNELFFVVGPEGRAALQEATLEVLNQ
jgi:hypothetical protein